MLRSNHQGTFGHHQSNHWHSLKTLIPHPGTNWSGKVTCFKTNPINCTLLCRWDPSYKEPWLILTDIEPENADLVGKRLRYWIECNYRDIKSDGWQWQKNRLTEPGRKNLASNGSSYFMDSKRWGKCRF